MLCTYLHTLLQNMERADTNINALCSPPDVHCAKATERDGMAEQWEALHMMNI